jgi:hypothetical protein
LIAVFSTNEEVLDKFSEQSERRRVVMCCIVRYWNDRQNPDGEGYADEWVEEGQLRNLGSNIGIM